MESHVEVVRTATENLPPYSFIPDYQNLIRNQALWYPCEDLNLEGCVRTTVVYPVSLHGHGALGRT
jgi:hypothetical protein